MKAQHSDLTKRLRRLVESGLCPSENAKAFMMELKGLTEKVSDEETVKRESKIFKALSDPTRLKMIGLLRMRDMCVCEIMAALDLTQPTASHHLNMLEDAGLLKDRREGKWVFYTLADQKIPSFISKVPTLSSKS